MSTYTFGYISRDDMGGPDMMVWGEPAPERGKVRVEIVKEAVATKEERAGEYTREYTRSETPK